jgi:hypothetical protein
MSKLEKMYYTTFNDVSRQRIYQLISLNRFDTITFGVWDDYGYGIRF